MANDDSTSPIQILERCRQRAAEAKARAEQREAENSRQLFLPGFNIGVMPNHLNRSSLFAPIARGPRVFHHQQVMVSRHDCTLEYTGQQLDEADADIIMALIWFAQKYPFGEHVPINRAELLRVLGRTKSKPSYEWLHRRTKALTEATLFLEARKPNGSTRYRVGRTYAFHILVFFRYDEDAETYTFQLDPRWVELFSNREYALLDWDARLQIGRDMAKTLQRLIATSADPVQKFGLDQIKAQMVYKSPMRKFRQALMSAVAELERLDIIKSGEIETSTKGKTQLVIYLPEKLQIKEKTCVHYPSPPPPRLH